jgi:hypothetical protein
MTNEALPSIPELLNKPTCSTWLRSALQGVLFGGREPFTAARDARLLADLLEVRAAAMGKANGLAYYDGRRPPLVDLFLPLVEADLTNDVTCTGSQPARANHVLSLQCR